MHRLLLLLLSLLCTQAEAQIYKSTDANGNTVYSEQPPAGRASQKMELPPLNSVPMPKAKPAPVPVETAPAPVPTAAYTVLELTGIPGDGAIRANNGTFDVGVNLQPRLAGGHLLQLVLDDVAYGTPSNVPRLQLVNVDRGQHRLAVQVLAGANVVQASTPVTISVLRVSVP
ncbi:MULTISPECIES: DUF4124 domain-containing protein [Pseudomonas]|uniref:DUF4124 domain-containing protein n=1 Tax=Pseudomonas quercus TaxID=2722792 RepID=A0ABX0YES8_9PSED|nr:MULTISPECIES: DUF4124 domain-containing protein [Pseudomonas]MBF7142178.1 DUF4124 domain-containing protein [Pseudomonas sp. LY10J]NJP00716.1 DUF4124 domain-containing protein [Pseudomonas quercus]